MVISISFDCFRNGESPISVTKLILLIFLASFPEALPIVASLCSWQTPGEVAKGAGRREEELLNFGV